MPSPFQRKTASIQNYFNGENWYLQKELASEGIKWVALFLYKSECFPDDFKALQGKHTNRYIPFFNLGRETVLFTTTVV